MIMMHMASPGPGGESPRIRKLNPTALDVVFIVFVSVALLLFLLWLLPGGEDKYANAPPFIRDLVTGVWGKITAAGGGLIALLLRRLIDKSPSPNYLVWIPLFMVFLIATLLMLFQVTSRFVSNPQAAMMRLPVKIGLDRPLQGLEARSAPHFNLWQDRPIFFNPHGEYPGSNPIYPYEDVLDVASDQNTLAYIKLAPQMSQTSTSSRSWDYKICLTASLRRPKTPTDVSSILSCSNESCVPAKGEDPGYVIACQSKPGDAAGLLSTVYAASLESQSRENGWDVPSIGTLEAINDRQRVGYTQFDITFVPRGKALEADLYYFIVRVNGQPIYIDGLSPDLKKEPLKKNGPNEIHFALQNLNYTGEHEGYETLHVTVLFLKSNVTIYRQELEREYVALRSADEVARDTPVGTFHWMGKYISPRNENKYEVLLASASCGANVQECTKRSMTAKETFDKAKLKFGTQSVVMVIRPPLRTPPSYGLALGLVQPTSQIQFTFNAVEAAQLCKWATEQVGRGRAGNLIQSDLRIYDPATRQYQTCK